MILSDGEAYSLLRAADILKQIGRDDLHEELCAIYNSNEEEMKKAKKILAARFNVDADRGTWECPDSFDGVCWYDSTGS
jgi:hypothetical protein